MRRLFQRNNGIGLCIVKSIVEELGGKYQGGGRSRSGNQIHRESEAQSIAGLIERGRKRGNRRESGMPDSRIPSELVVNCKIQHFYARLR